MSVIGNIVSAIGDVGSTVASVAGDVVSGIADAAGSVGSAIGDIASTVGDALGSVFCGGIASLAEKALAIVLAPETGGASLAIEGAIQAAQGNTAGGVATAASAFI